MLGLAWRPHLIKALAGLYQLAFIRQLTQSKALDIYHLTNNTRMLYCMDYAVRSGYLPHRCSPPSEFHLSLCIDTLAHSWLRQKSQPLSFQTLPHSCPQNTRGGIGYSSPLAVRFSLPSNFPRINTYKSVSKQTTLTSFRMNTYEKPGEGWVPELPSKIPFNFPFRPFDFQLSTVNLFKSYKPSDLGIASTFRLE